MQRVTRSNIDNTLVHVEDPEQIIRVRRRSMAVQGEVSRNLRVTRDSDGEEYSEAEEVNIPDLYVPDLDNTHPEESHQKWNGTKRGSNHLQDTVPQAQRVHRNGHTHSLSPRRMTGSTHRATYRLQGKLCFQPIRPTQIVD